MSWQTINEILGLAATDKQFAQELLIDPVDAVVKRGYRLTASEQEAFRRSAGGAIDTFSQNLLYHLSQKPEASDENSSPTS